MEQEFVYHLDQTVIDEIYEVKEILRRSNGVNYVIKEFENGFSIYQDVTDQIELNPNDNIVIKNQ